MWPSPLIVFWQAGFVVLAHRLPPFPFTKAPQYGEAEFTQITDHIVVSEPFNFTSCTNWPYHPGPLIFNFVKRKLHIRSGKVPHILTGFLPHHPTKVQCKDKDKDFDTVLQYCEMVQKPATSPKHSRQMTVEEFPALLHQALSYFSLQSPST